MNKSESYVNSSYGLTIRDLLIARREQLKGFTRTPIQASLAADQQKDADKEAEAEKVCSRLQPCRGTLLTRKRIPLGLYSRPVPRGLVGS